MELPPWPAEPAPGAVVRPAVRVIVVDDRERVLLLRYLEAEDGRPFWCPIGGGVEDGEDPRATIGREVLEETGWVLDREPIEIGRRRHVFDMYGSLMDGRERWYVVRTDGFDVDTSDWSDLERATIGEHRWWTVDELDRCAERTVPADLAALVRRLLVDGPPDELLDLPV